MRNGLTLRAGEFAPIFGEFDDLFQGFAAPTRFQGMTGEKSPYGLPVDVKETDTHYVMHFDMPGVAKEDLKLEFLDGCLTVSGERKSERREEKDSQHLSERYFGAFSRSFAFPTAVDSERIEARYDNGVLEIKVPKSEESKPRQIPIGSGPH